MHLGGAVGRRVRPDRQERAREDGLAFVHPFDDPDVVAGQGTLGLELLEDVAGPRARWSSRSAAAGSAAASRSPSSRRGPRSRWSACRSPTRSLTIADGIAVKRPGELTLPLLEQWVDEMAIVGEDEIAEAMVLLMERAKLVVEGAGAVGVAALLGGQVAAAARHDGRGAVGRQRRPGPAGRDRPPPRDRGRAAGSSLLTRVADRPGALAGLLALRRGDRARTSSTSRTTARAWTCTSARPACELVLETRGREHAKRVMATLRGVGLRGGRR